MSDAAPARSAGISRGEALLGGVALAGFVLLVLLLRGALLGADDFARADLRLYYYPMYEASYARVARGGLPLWNPHQLCGIPWLATLQAGLLYPGHLLYLMFSTETALVASTALHLWILAAGAAALVRCAGASGTSALVAGALATCLGVVPRLAASPNLLEAGAWLAPGCVAVLAGVRGGGLAWVAGLSLCVGASLLAGYPQYTVYLAYAWGALALGGLATTRPPPSVWLRVLAGLAAAIALGALLAGAQLLPAFELAREGARSLGPVSPSQMFPFGGADSAMVGIEGRRRALSGTGMPLGLGAVVSCLLPVALLGRSRALWLVLLAIAGLAVLFALGPATPLFSLYLALPGLATFRLPLRILFVSHFFLALVVGGAFDVLVRAGSREPVSRLTPTRALGTWGGIVALIFAGIGDLRSAAFAAATAATALLGGRRPWLQPGAVACLLGLEILMGSAVAGGAGEPFEFTRVYHRDRPAYADLRRIGGRSWIVGAGLSSRIPPKVASLFDLRSIEDYAPFALRRQAEYFEHFAYADERPEGAPPFYGRILRGLGALEDAYRRVRLLDLAAMRGLAATRQDLTRAPLRQFLERAGFRPVRSEDRRLSVFQNPNALPRSFVTYRAEVAPEPRELLAILSAPDFDPMLRSYVEGGFRLEPAAGGPSRGHPARIVVDEPETVVVEAELDAPGLLVLADSYYPGWRASVDGEPAGIHATNHLFRGVAAPAGRHEIRFEYRPASVRLGIAASAAGVFGLVALSWVARRRSGRGGLRA